MPDSGNGSRKPLAAGQANDLAVKVCCLQYDQTSLVFEELSCLLTKTGTPSAGVPPEINRRYAAAAAKMAAARKRIGAAWNNSGGHMAECEGKHARTVEGYTDMAEIAAHVYGSNMIICFLGAATNEFMRQSCRDAELNHPRVSFWVRQAAYSIDEAVEELI
jgi:hypothetical protein